MSLIKARDKRIADSAEDCDDRGVPLRCVASGCPWRWSVDKGGARLCGAHAWADPHLWPRITQGLLDGETNRALDAQREPETRPVKSLSFPEKRALLIRLRSVLSEPKNPKAWIDRLVAKREAGEILSPMQKHALREVGR